MRRRELLGGAVALGAGGAVAAALLPAAPARAHSTSDPDLLASALVFEQIVARAYEILLARRLLGAAAAGALTTILAQERLHAESLRRYIDEIAAPQPHAPQGLNIIELALPGLHAVKGEAGALAYAMRAERAQIYSYDATIALLTDQKLTQNAIAILGAESQHLVVLREHAGLAPLTGPFEAGARADVGAGRVR